MVFLVTYVVPNFADLYNSMQAKLPDDDACPDRHRHHGAELHRVRSRRRWSAAIFLFRWWARRESAKEKMDRVKLRTAAARRDLAEIPGGAVRAHFEHAAGRRHSAGAGHGNRGRFAGHAAAASALVEAAGKMVREGQPLSGSLTATEDVSRRWPST